MEVAQKVVSGFQGEVLVLILIPYISSIQISCSPQEEVVRQFRGDQIFPQITH